MPSLGADLDHGTITAWHVRPGDHVKRGDTVADVETDKGTIEIEIWQDGIISEILVEPGKRAQVGTTLARFESPTSTMRPVELPSEPMKPKPLEITPPVQLDPSVARISPLARRLASELQVDISKIQGTGEGGAITKIDVEDFVKKEVSPDQKFVEPTGVLIAKPEKLLPMHQATALAMAKSKREIPHYYLQSEIMMNHALNWLTGENAKGPITERILPVALTLKAIAVGAKRFPEVNGQCINGTFLASPTVNLGVAISLRGGGLVAPAILNADQLTVRDLMKNVISLVERARSGKLRASEVSEQTITVTNLGDSVVDTIFGVIHPPQVAIVGLGRVIDHVIASNGMIGPVSVQRITLSGDHRVSDGHRGGLFLAEVSRLLQTPERL